MIRIGEDALRPESRRLARITAGIAIVGSLLTALGIPAAYVAFALSHEYGEIQADARARAEQITQVISRNPDYWQFDAHGIDGILAKADPHDTADLRRVVLEDDGLVYEHTPESEPGRLSISATEALYDSGQPVGRIEIVRSVVHVALWTALLSVLSVLLAVGSFFLIRQFPLRAMEKAWSEASHDPLTGLPNRVLLGDRIEQALSRMRENGDPLAVFSLDLDHFKDVNDTMGHGAGDELLTMVARRLISCVRDYDTVARLGGDEFVILQLGVDNSNDLAAMARKLIDAVSQPYDIDGKRALIGVSIGIVAPKDPMTGMSQLLQAGDAALYRAKANNRRTFCFFDEAMNDEIRKRHEAERELTVALEEEQFVIYYQPQVSLETGRVAGVEALLRWNHPTRGMLDPSFVQLAEESGLIVPIGEWVLRTACRECAKWPGIRLAVNVSPVQLVKSDLVSMVRRVLDDTGFDPHLLELEVTESILIQRTDMVLKTLAALKEMGIQIAMDDFGTGYSSLSYLRKFPFDRLKIDSTFLQEFGDDTEIRALLHAIIKMGESFRISVTAEGVETGEQLEWLMSEKCSEAQGYHFTRPLRAEDADHFIRTFRAGGAREGGTADDGEGLRRGQGA